MSRRRRVGINTLFQMLLNGKIVDTHHLVPRENGGSNKESNKMKGSALDHRIWHYFVKNLSLDDVADKFSKFVNRDCRFFALSKGESIHETVQKINQWLENDDIKIEVLEQSKIIQFRPISREDSFNLPRIIS